MFPLFAFLALISSAFSAELESIGSIPASALDSLGDTAGSYGSGACYDRKAGILYLTTDRGPGDGTIDYAPRLYALPLPKDSVNVNEPSSARPYKDVSGQPFTGLIPDSSDPEPRMKDGRRCLDP